MPKVNFMDQIPQKLARKVNNKQLDQDIAAARQAGTIFGRPRKPLPENFEEIYARFRKGESINKLSKETPAISTSTLRLRLYERYEQDEGHMP